MPDMILSMTTHGDRVPLVTRVLAPTAERAAKAGFHTALTLYKADVPRMAEELKRLVGSGAVELLVADEDLGSNLKYYEAMRRFPDSVVMVHDDDILFRPETFVEMAAFARDYPGCVGCRRTRHMMWTAPAWPGPFPKGYRITSSTDVSAVRPLADEFAEGCKGIVFPAGCFADLLSDETMLRDIREHCLHDDDIALALMSERAGLPTYLVPCAGPLADVDYYAGPTCPVGVRKVEDQTINRTALWRQGRNGMRTTECLRHFARELWFYKHIRDLRRSERGLA